MVRFGERLYLGSDSTGRWGSEERMVDEVTSAVGPMTIPAAVDFAQ
jgi:hypothetical protein